jgi:hypothetical protein
MREFETALGQYLLYQTFLSIPHPKCQVYLAIADMTQRLQERLWALIDYAI